MSISIYYTARRSESLTAAEETAIRRLVGAYAIEGQMAEREGTGEESLCIYNLNDLRFPAESGVIFGGDATGLPSELLVW